MQPLTTCVIPLLLAANVALAQAQPEVVRSVDLDRYAGRWYEIARFPNRFQRDCAGEVRATYTRRPDGRIDVRNECTTADGRQKDAGGVARVVDPATNARLEVRFAPAFLSWLPAVWGDYWIVGLDAEYRWAVVGSPDRKYLWILARDAAMDDTSYSAALQRAAAGGFDTSRLVRTRQQSPR